LEHYSEQSIKRILVELSRVLKKRGKMIIFWPPEFGLSVRFFKILVFITQNILGFKNVKFHPDEITRIKSRKDAERIFMKAGLKVVDYYFGIRDFFTYCVIVAEKQS